MSDAALSADTRIDWDQRGAAPQPAETASEQHTTERTERAVAHQPLRLSWPRKLRLALTVTDLAAVVAAVVIAQAVRFGEASDALDTTYGALSIVYGAVWVICLTAVRSREPRVVGVGSEEFRRVVSASLAAFALVAVLAFLLKADVSRGYLAVAMPLGIVLLISGRLAWRKALRSMRQRGRCLTGAIIVGPRAEVSRCVRQLERNLLAGFRPIAAVVTDDDVMMGDDSDDLPRITLEQLPSVSIKTRTRAVMIAGDLPGGREQIQRLGWKLERSNLELVLVSRLTDVAGPRMHLRAVEGLPMVHVDLPQYSGVSYTVKRVIDVVLSALALVLLSPVLAVIALAVRTTSEGPALFLQKRVGVEGRTFMLVKFRSMIVDAEQRLDELRAFNEGNGLLFKLKADPRVTRVGAFLRRYSLDELPQLWNVLKGEMSLVGPRPPLPSEVEQYTEPVHRRLLIKPGITGLWQVSGRSNLDLEESMKLDLHYVENWSVMGDLTLLARTVKAVMRRDGAY